MIGRGSRYERVPVLQTTLPGGRVVSYLGIRSVTQLPATFRHTFRAHQRLDLLAYEFYRRPERWWLIGDANTAMDPADLAVPGRQLLVPPEPA
jgi:hypothetical protein